MFVSGVISRGLPAILNSLVVVVIVVLGLGCPCVSSRPQSWQENRGEAQASTPLRFSPELLLEPSLESAVSPVNVLPYHPSPSTHHAPHTQTNYNDLKVAPVVDGDDSRRFSQDLDGPEEQWDHDPDTEDSDAPPTRRWPTERTQDLPRDKVVVSPLVMDDLNVDRFHGALPGFGKQDGNEDLDVPELRLRGRDRDPFRAARSGYIRAPHKVLDPGVPSPEMIARDVDVDGPRLPNAHISMPDDVPADPRQVVPWPEMLEKDVDVDRPIRHDSSLPRAAHPTSLTGEDTAPPRWKNMVLKDLDVDTDMAAHAHAGEKTDVDVDMEHNPFEDDDTEENEVPEELVRKVVQAMEAPPPWRQSPTSQQEEDEDIWGEGSGDGTEEADQYIDWVIREQSRPRNSRLITLIFEIIDDPNGDREEAEEDEEEEEDSAAAYDKELSIWQILTNFPFPMLVHQSDDTAFLVDYIYDDDDDDDYDDEEYDDDYYDEYDDEYEDYEDDDDDDDDDEEEYTDDEDDDRKDDDQDESDDDLDDYFYSEEYDDCDDCTEDDDTIEQEMTVLSLGPMLTK